MYVNKLAKAIGSTILSEIPLCVVRSRVYRSLFLLPLALVQLVASLYTLCKIIKHCNKQIVYINY